MNYYQKSAAALVETIRDLTAEGYDCYTAMTEYSAVDLIATKQNQTLRLQVKYREAYDGIVNVKLQCVIRAALYGPTPKFEAIDGWAIFCSDIGCVVYVSKNDVDLGEASFGFAITDPQTNRKLYSDYKHVTEW